MVDDMTREKLYDELDVKVGSKIYTYAEGFETV